MTQKNIDPDVLRLEDILQAIEEAIALRKSIASDRNHYLAACYCLVVIGEATNKLSQATRSRYSDIPWRDMIAMRNRIAHDYGNIDVARIVETIEHDLPQLVIPLKQILQKMDT